MGKSESPLKFQIDSLRGDIFKLRESVMFLHKKVQELYPLKDNNLKEDISVIIGIRDKYDYKIENALKSLRNQDYNPALVKIILVDYGSKIRDFLKLKKLCERYCAEYIRVRRISNWNRAHCLNIGIKRAKTKYILLSDLDIVFENNYISESIKELKKNPYQIIFSEVFESLEGSINYETDIIGNFQRLKRKCTTRNERTKMYDYTFGLGIIVILRKFLQDIRGLDENYKVWGFEDEDLIERLKIIGLTLKKLETSSYIHQWHPRFEGVQEKDKFQIQENFNYLKKSSTIERNLFGWGEI